MFRKAVKRAGSSQVKFLFKVEVQYAVIPKSKGDITSTSLISIGFEKGSKVTATKDIRPSESGSDWKIDVKETLSLVITLYRDSSGSYQEKKARLIVRSKKKALLGGSAFKELGSFTLDLHSLATAAGEFHQSPMVMTLKKCPIEGSTINTFVTTKFMGEGGDDSQSVASATSEQDMAVDESEYATATGSESTPPLQSQLSIPSLKLSPSSPQHNVVKGSPPSSPRYSKALDVVHETPENEVTADNDERAKEIEELLERLSQSEQGRRDMEAGLAIAQTSIEEAALALKDRDQQLTEVNSRLSNLTAKLDESHQETSELRTSLATLRSTHEAAVQEQTRLVKELEESRALMADVSKNSSADLQAYDGKIKDLEKQLVSQREAERLKYDTDIKALQAETRKTLQDMQSENDILKSRLDAMEQSLSGSQTENVRYKSNLELAEKKFADADMKYKALVADREVQERILRDEITLLKSARSAVQDNLSIDLQRQLDIAHGVIAEMKKGAELQSGRQEDQSAVVQQRDKELEDLRVTLRQAQKEKLELSGRVTSLLESINTEANKAAQFQAQLQMAQTALLTSQADFENNLTTVEQRYKASRTDFVSKMEAKERELDNELSKLRIVIDEQALSLEQKDRLLEEQSSKIKSANDSESGRNAALLIQIQDLQSHTTSIESNLVTSRRTNEDLAARLSVSETNKKDLSERHDELTSQYTSLEERYSQLVADLDDNRKRVQDRDAQVQELDSQLLILRRECQALKGGDELSAAAIEKMADDYKAKLSEKEALYRLMQEELSEAKEKISAAQTESHALLVQLDVVRKELSEKQSSTLEQAFVMEGLNEKLKELRKEIRELKEQLTAKDSEIAAVRATLDTKPNQQQNAELNGSALQNALKTSEQSLLEYEKELAAARAEANAATKAAAEATRAGAEYQAEVMRLKAALGDVSGSATTDSVHGWSVDVAQLSQRLVDKEKEAEDVSNELLAAKMQLANLAQEKDEEKAKVGDYKKRMQKYAERVMALELQLVELRERIVMADNRLEKRGLFGSGTSRFPLKPAKPVAGATAPSEPASPTQTLHSE